VISAVIVVKNLHICNEGQIPFGIGLQVAT